MAGRATEYCLPKTASRIGTLEQKIDLGGSRLFEEGLALPLLATKSHAEADRHTVPFERFGEFFTARPGFRHIMAADRNDHHFV